MGLERTENGICFLGSIDADPDVEQAARLAAYCGSYRTDDEDEDLLAGAVNCFGCRYRRWTSGGFTCMKQLLPADLRPGSGAGGP